MQRTRGWAGASPAAWLMLVLAAFGAASAWRMAQAASGIDFYHFWLVPKIIARGETANIYSEPEAQRLGELYQQRAESRPGAERLKTVARFRRVLDPSATPFLYTVFRPFVGEDYERDYAAFGVVCLAMGIVSVLGLSRLMGHDWTTALAAAALAGWCFEPFRADLRVGNVNQIQLAGLAAVLALCRPDRRSLDIAAGALIGLGLMFKPTLWLAAGALWLALAALRRRDRLKCHLVGAAAGALAALAVSSAFFGTPDCWQNWVRHVPTVVDRMEIAFGNFGPARLLRETTGVNFAWPLTALCAAALAACVWRGGRAPAGPTETPAGREAFDTLSLAVAVGCAGGLVASSLAWVHYFTLLIPLVLLLLRQAAGESAAATLVRRLVVVLAVAAMSGWPHPPILKGGPFVQQSAECSIASLMLFAMGLWQLGRRRRGADGRSTETGPGPTAHRRGGSRPSR